MWLITSWSIARSLDMLRLVLLALTERVWQQTTVATTVTKLPAEGTVAVDGILFITEERRAYGYSARKS